MVTMAGGSGGGDSDTCKHLHDFHIFLFSGIFFFFIFVCCSVCVYYTKSTWKTNKKTKNYNIFNENPYNK